MNRRRFLELTTATTLTAGAFGGFAGIARAYHPARSTPSSRPQTQAPSIAMEGMMDKMELPEMAYGDKNAPVIIVEYGSLICPYCKSFHENFLPEIKSKYIDTGKVYFVKREFPYEPRAMAAFMLARCAPNGNYFPMIDLLYKQQARWGHPDNNPVVELQQISKLAGFTEETFRACLTDQNLLNKINAVKNRGQDKFGVRGTPTFFINSKRFSGDFSKNDLITEIEKLL